jgi:hypothetical protein
VPDSSAYATAARSTTNKEHRLCLKTRWWWNSRRMMGTPTRPISLASITHRARVSVPQSFERLASKTGQTPVRAARCCTTRRRCMELLGMCDTQSVELRQIWKRRSQDGVRAERHGLLSVDRIAIMSRISNVLLFILLIRSAAAADRVTSSGCLNWLRMNRFQCPCCSAS